MRRKLFFYKLKDMIRSKMFLMFAFGMTTFACDSDSPKPVSPDLPDLHICGFVGFTGVYWKNEIAIALPGATNPTSISVSDKDIYIAGFGNNGNYNYAVYWKNGIETKLTDGTSNATAQAICVSNTDVYVAGQISDSFGASFGVYWKNGVINSIPNSVRTTSIKVVGSDVYVTGAMANPPNDGYWKNGVLINLPHSFYVNDITTRGADVYAVGAVLDPIPEAVPKAAFWKNGEVTLLNDGTYATSIAVSGSDVHIGGYYYHTGTPTALYWKNEEVTFLGEGRALSISILGSDVYLCGIDGSNIPVYWKNGVPTQLPINLGQGSGGLANGIAIN
jgi:hypothetical protein